MSFVTPVKGEFSKSQNFVFSLRKLILENPSCLFRITFIYWCLFVPGSPHTFSLLADRTARTYRWYHLENKLKLSREQCEPPKWQQICNGSSDPLYLWF